MKNNVFKLLRIKLSVTIMALLGVVMICVIGSFIYVADASSKKNGYNFVSRILENDGVCTEDHIAMASHYRVSYYETNYCSLYISKQGDILDFIQHFKRHMNINWENVEKIRTRFNQNKVKHTGRIKNYIYSLKEVEGDRYLLVILDMTEEFSVNKRFAFFATIVFSISLVIFFFLALFISKGTTSQAEEAFENQKRFIADASHELKTPVAVISANLDVLENDFPDNKWIGYIRSENNRMGELVKELLFLAKNDSGRKNTYFSKFDLKEMIACTVLPYQTMVFEQKKTLTLKLPEKNQVVIGDENKIKQLVVILLDNAIKYSSENDMIQISCGTSASHNFIKVYNTGFGIEHANRKRIFERFFREDSSRTRNSGGYGLGLSIADSIAKSHGGKIKVKSEAGKFAEFTFTFPKNGLKADTSFVQ